MTSWPTNESLQQISLQLIGALSPHEVLYEFEGPCIFTTHTSVGVYVLAYLCEELEEQELLRFLLSTTSAKTIAELKTGAIDVREALERGSLWLVDMSFAYEPRLAFAISHEQLPDDALPEAGVMLWPSLQPALVIKLEGEDVQEGAIPAAALSQAAEIASRAFKPLFEWAARGLRPDTGGRPPEWLRHLYALPTQRVAFGSLVVAFGSATLEGSYQPTLPFGEHEQLSPHDIQQAAWGALREGLAWLSSTDEQRHTRPNDEKWLAVLEAMQRIAPAMSGPVTNIQLWGSLIGAEETPITLDRASTKRIRSELTTLKQHHQVQLRVCSGLIRELDLDKLTLILRDDPDGEGDLSLELDNESLLDLAKEAHYHELQVNAVARSDDGRRWTATALEFTGDTI